ncbi:TetR/AcrR family transcriptional regulator [Nocardiopsis ansamitocini]|uniref:TetR/AcrR family transcriptional regulator n=1 Tax=Nocardiopsis ansamitocini TaxID=1670832 RepID=UPI002556DDC9|nr:TetR family transcriptional regulator [Nocardiopsis ansamitocini]
MIDGAKKPVGRAAKKSRTRHELSRVARELVARHGMAGFTVDELAAEVGVSRRTFFNYFPTKEHAVIGRVEDGFDDDLVEWFLAGAAPGRLVDDLVEFSVSHLVRLDIGFDDIETVRRALDREPQLLNLIVRDGEEHDRRLIDLVRTREGLPEEDPVPRLAVRLVGVVMRTASEEILRHGPGTDLGALVHTHLAAARALFAPAPTDHTA